MIEFSMAESGILVMQVSNRLLSSLYREVFTQYAYARNIVDCERLNL